MSIVAYYARLNAAQMEHFSPDPSALESGAEPGIEIIDVGPKDAVRRMATQAG